MSYIRGSDDLHEHIKCQNRSTFYGVCGAAEPQLVLSYSQVVGIFGG